MIMDDRHPEDCPICRAKALGFTEDQVELLTEVLMCGIYGGWKERGRLDLPPRNEQVRRANLRAMAAWTEIFGTEIPESAEVQAHRHRGD